MKMCVGMKNAPCKGRACVGIRRFMFSFRSSLTGLVLRSGQLYIIGLSLANAVFGEKSASTGFLRLPRSPR
jgi:hypothetical protein